MAWRAGSVPQVGDLSVSAKQWQGLESEEGPRIQMPPCACKAAGHKSCWAVSGRGQLPTSFLPGVFGFFCLHLQERSLSSPLPPFPSHFLFPFPFPFFLFSILSFLPKCITAGKIHPYHYTLLIPQAIALSRVVTRAIPPQRGEPSQVRLRNLVQE